METKTLQKHGQLVGKVHVDELVRNYKKQRWLFNSQRIGKDDSISTTFNLDSLSLIFLNKHPRQRLILSESTLGYTQKNRKKTLNTVTDKLS